MLQNSVTISTIRRFMCDTKFYLEIKFIPAQKVNTNKFKHFRQQYKYREYLVAINTPFFTAAIRQIFNDRFFLKGVICDWFHLSQESATRYLQIILSQFEVNSSTMDKPEYHAFFLIFYQIELQTLLNVFLFKYLVKDVNVEDNE